MTAETASARAARVSDFMSYCVALAWFCAAVVCFVGLPLLTLAENRLAPGRPVPGTDLIGGSAVLALAAGLVGFLGLVRGRGPWAARLAVAAFAIALPCLAETLGQGAARTLIGAAPAARVSLSSGAWLLLALLGGALGLAIRRSGIPGLGIATAFVLVLALVGMDHLGRFDALSLAVEYAARRETVHAALREHLLLSGAALLLAIVGAILLTLWRRGQGLVALLLAGIQVVPAVALLGGLVALTSGLLRALPDLRAVGLSALGPVPAVVAIGAYLLLPLWRGLTLALRAPDPATLDAALALGLTPLRILAGLRLPLGAPILVGALRVAAVQSLGLATLGALVGAGGLGRIVFDGMAQFAPDLILLGAIPVVVLSLAAETVLSRIEAATRRRWHA